MKETYIDLIKSLIESRTARILISFFFLLLSLIIAFDFRGSQTEMIPDVLKYLVPISYAGIVVSLIWFLYEAAWKQLPRQQFSSRSKEMYSCLKKIEDFLGLPDPTPLSNELDALSSFWIVGNMLKSRFGIEYPTRLKNEPVGQYLLACCSFLVEMLKYAEVGNLKTAREYSKKISPSSKDEVEDEFDMWYG